MGFVGISENRMVFLSPFFPLLRWSSWYIMYLVSVWWALPLNTPPQLNSSAAPRLNVKTYLENLRGVNMCKRAYFDANAHTANCYRNILITLSCWAQHPTNCIIDVEFDQHFSSFSEYITIFFMFPRGYMENETIPPPRPERWHIFWQQIFWFWLRNCIQASEISCLLCLLFQRPSRFFQSQRI